MCTRTAVHERKTEKTHTELEISDFLLVLLVAIVFNSTLDI